LKDERISQVWFAGVHSNVGDGYPDDALGTFAASVDYGGSETPWPEV
jgi:hypothetical protein